MKNVIITFILTLFALSVSAQGQSYYNGSTAKGTNVTYNCEHYGPVVTISNVNNRYEKVEPKRWNGSVIPIDEKITTVNASVIFQSISEVLPTSATEWRNDRKRPTIFVTINTSGVVIEVGFRFLKDLQWGSIPPDKYYQIEQKLKQRLKFALTADQKKQNIVKAIL